MDEYLSRRIKNWGAWQQPDPALRNRLLEMAAGPTPVQNRNGLLDRPRKWANRMTTNNAPEKNLFSTRFTRHSQLAFVNLEIIWRTSPLRYA
jgi:hypothetical protein